MIGTATIKYLSNQQFLEPGLSWVTRYVIHFAEQKSINSSTRWRSRYKNLMQGVSVEYAKPVKDDST